jgi:hypothetical protein
VNRLLNALGTERAKRIRLRFAVVLFGLSMVGWPVSALTVAKNEPQFILGLSWLAITLTAWDILTTAQVHKENGDDDGDDTDGDDPDGS